MPTTRRTNVRAVTAMKAPIVTKVSKKFNFTARQKKNTQFWTSMSAILVIPVRMVAAAKTQPLALRNMILKKLWLHPKISTSVKTTPVMTAATKAPASTHRLETTVVTATLATRTVTATQVSLFSQSLLEFIRNTKGRLENSQQFDVQCDVQ